MLGVDAYYPQADRRRLAMRLNALVAAPGFAPRLQGSPLRIEELLWDPNGRPRAAIVHLAHLSDPERSLVVTAVLSRLVTWTRPRPGNSTRRVAVVVDEALGFAPPTSSPPMKRPLLILLEQDRAHGVGVVPTTQNPTDLDYQKMASTGTWWVGRLQTEHDKAGIGDALASANGAVDLAALDAATGGLGRRRFLEWTARGDHPELLTTRWAMSYLRGPLTRDEIARLVHGDDDPETPAARPVGGGEVPAPAPVVTLPPIADGVPVRWLDPAAPWAPLVGADSRRPSMRTPAVAATAPTTRPPVSSADTGHASGRCNGGSPGLGHQRRKRRTRPRRRTPMPSCGAWRR